MDSYSMASFTEAGMLEILRQAVRQYRPQKAVGTGRFNNRDAGHRYCIVSDCIQSSALDVKNPLYESCLFV